MGNLMSDAEEMHKMNEADANKLDTIGDSEPDMDPLPSQLKGEKSSADCVSDDPGCMKKSHATSAALGKLGAGKAYGK